MTHPWYHVLASFRQLPSLPSRLLPWINPRITAPSISFLWVSENGRAGSENGCNMMQSPIPRKHMHYVCIYIIIYILCIYIYKYIIHIYIYWHMIYIYILTCKKTHVKTIWKHVNHWTYVPLIPGSWRTTTANRYPKKRAWNHSSVLAFGLHEPLESLDSCHPNWVWWKLKTCEYRDSWSFSISFNCRNEWDTTLKYTEQHFNPCPF